MGSIQGTRHPVRAIWARAVFGLGVVIAGVVFAGSAIGAPGGGRPTSGIAYIAEPPKPSSSLNYEAGFTYDKVLGQGAVTFETKALVKSSGAIEIRSNPVTMYFRNGSLTGSGRGLLTITNKPKPGDAKVTNGFLLLNRGTGRFAGHSLRVTFTGTGNIGGADVPDSYTFRYKGVYR